MISVLHISDLHFVQQVTMKGRRHWSGVKSHSHAKISALARCLRRLQRTEKIDVDVLLVTGDVSTDGSSDSLTTARLYFNDDRVSEGTPPRLKCRGLNIPPSNSLVIPGNHDRYGILPVQQPSDALENVFQPVGYVRSGSYPYIVAYETPSKDGAKGMTALFFVFDSTLTDPSMSEIPMDKIACGFVSSEDCDWLSDQRDELAGGATVPSLLDGSPITVDYDKAVKIVVLHHHPVREVKPEKPKVSDNDRGLKRLLGGLKAVIKTVITLPKRWSSKVSKRLTVMYNSDEFIQACYVTGVDIVLFGHEHKAYNVRYTKPGWSHPVDFFCCSSTSEYSVTDSGFYLFQFREEDYTVKCFRWNAREDSAGVGTSFIEEETMSRDYARNVTS